jgi:hypothetical protein
MTLSGGFLPVMRIACVGQLVDRVGVIARHPVFERDRSVDGVLAASITFPAGGQHLAFAAHLVLERLSPIADLIGDEGPHKQH